MRRLQRAGIAGCLGACILASACSSGSGPRAGADHGTAHVRLVPADADLLATCRSAQLTVGFTVPCPHLVPLVHGQPARCSTGCVITNVGQAPSFFFDVQDFDAPSTYHGVGDRPFGHLNIWAMRPVDAPPGCWHGHPHGTRPLGLVTASVFVCPSAGSNQAQREIQHGEAIFSHHLLYAWSTADARYFVSAHGGNTPANRELLDRLVSSMHLP
jgi:hypothetical protein